VPSKLQRAPDAPPELTIEQLERFITPVVERLVEPIVDRAVKRAVDKPRGLKSIKEFCATHGLGPSTVYNLLNTKQLEGVKLGPKTFIRPEAEAKWMASLPAYEPGPTSKPRYSQARRANAAEAEATISSL
jgi:hypothetical protein